MSYSFEVQPSVVSLPFEIPSLTTLNGTAARPSPDSEPCVPCRLSTRRRRVAGAAGAFETVLELGGSGGVPAGSRLLDVVLEVGPGSAEPAALEAVVELPTRYHLGGVDYQQALANGYFDFLEGLEQGIVVEVLLSGLPDLTGRTLSVRYQLVRDDGEEYWDSTPVANHLDVAPVLFSDSFDLGDSSVWQTRPSAASESDQSNETS